MRPALVGCALGASASPSSVVTSTRRHAATSQRVQSTSNAYGARQTAWWDAAAGTGSRARSWRRGRRRVRIVAPQAASGPQRLAGMSEPTNSAVARPAWEGAAWLAAKVLGAVLLFNVVRAAVQRWGRAQLEDEYPYDEVAAAPPSAPGDAVQPLPAQERARMSLLKDDNLGRIAYVAAVTGEKGELEWQQRFWSALLARYSGADDPLTGLLLAMPGCVLHVIEGDNNQLFGLLRELLPRHKGHGMETVRVPYFALDVRQRLFERWGCAAVSAGAARTSPARARLGLPSAAAGPSSAAAVVPGAPPGGGAAAAAAQQEFVERVQEVELFLKFVGPKLSALASETAVSQALANLRDFESSTPSASTVAALADSQSAPAVDAFLEAFDTDYERYQLLLSSNALPPNAPELLHLGRYYGDHLKRDLQEAMAASQKEAAAAAATARGATGPERVEATLERLKRSMETGRSDSGL